MENKFLKRKIYSKMLEWKKNYAPNYVLFLKGARRVGKTTLAEQFGLNEYQTFITIRFDKTPDSIKDLFINSLENLDYFFQVIQSFYKTKLHVGESLVILDEIQLYPLARQALKTLLEDNRYHYIETGSLAGITNKGNEILIPSEEYTLDVLPLDFEEFLWALDDDFTIDILKSHFINLKQFGKSYKLYLNLFRQYMLVGGMPQAVVTYVETKDFEKVDFVKQQIINLYKNDIKGQKSVNGDYVTSFLELIPSELGKVDKTFKLSHINKNARARDYGSAINWLKEAMIINIAHNSTEPSAAISINLGDKKFKCYLMDTGLLISLTYNNKKYIENELYTSILMDKLHINEGMIIENLVAQCLKSSGDNIYFYVKTDTETKKTTLEIDFIIRRNKKIIPIEVKSSDNYTISSLIKYKKTFNNKIGVQYVLHDGDIRKEGEVIYLPYFLACII